MITFNDGRCFVEVVGWTVEIISFVKVLPALDWILALPVLLIVCKALLLINDEFGTACFELLSLKGTWFVSLKFDVSFLVLDVCVFGFTCLLFPLLSLLDPALRLTTLLEPVTK